MDFSKLLEGFKGEWSDALTTRKLYATDASVYQELPQVVCFPLDASDVKLIVEVSNVNDLVITPRASGTSLGGQATGGGIVLDFSRGWDKVIHFDQNNGVIHVQPGIVREELNQLVEPFGWFFGPETSTSNRCMIGGMVGNNSCGSHSILYGSTRDHLLEVEVLLSDGQIAFFGDLSPTELEGKMELPGREGEIYRHLFELLSDPLKREAIHTAYPKPEIRRRNTGYAIDEIARQLPFVDNGQPFNLAKLVAGSEGTLGILLSAKLNLEPLPPAFQAVVAVHCSSIEEAALANLVGRSCDPGAIELLDKFILDCTKESLQQRENRYFVQGDPAALLVVEFARDTQADLESACELLIERLQKEQLGFHYPVIPQEDIGKVWDLRKAGLGLLSNVPGDAKPVACIEDTAVMVEDLPAYLKEFKDITTKYGKECVYYAHIGDGEIHLRPVLDLKKAEEQQVFHDMTNEIASLVKKYRGSLSGEHGDGRVRSPFLRKMVGDQVYEWLVELKYAWDPNGIFNRNKIVEASPMLSNLRYAPDQTKAQPVTDLSFNDSQGVLRMAEKCNGSADCRKSPLIGGTMCPSFMATRKEQDSTRARANALRDYYTQRPDTPSLSAREVKGVLDLCLSCKGCKKECPSNVDMAAMKSEFMSQWWKEHKPPIAVRYLSDLGGKLGRYRPISGLFNGVASSSLFKTIVQPGLGIAKQRSMPILASSPLKEELLSIPNPTTSNGIKIGVLCDEIVELFDQEIGRKGVGLLQRLGFDVTLLPPVESGRAALSAGIVDAAKDHATSTMRLLEKQVAELDYVVGLEPSAILMFKDDYYRLLEGSALASLVKWQSKFIVVEELIANQIASGLIKSEQFKSDAVEVMVHVHCHQKALADVAHVKECLSVIPNAKVEVLNTGCCGMSGAFGMQKEHYKLSMEIAELKLFPALRKAGPATRVVATGNSCRHQIKDGMKMAAQHPVEVLFDYLKDE